MTNRREFLAAGAAALAASSSTAGAAGTPWYRRTLRWGQTNITEKDPVRYDISWWREYWKKTNTQGVIINAGGIVAYYPSKFPLHHRAEHLGGRDLYGELCKAAHEDGLVVLARMDSNRVAEDFFRAYPDWFARNASGNPYRAADKYVTCINSPYYDEYIPSVLTEIIERSHPEGFADNSWAGLGRDSICYCANCARKFRDRTGQALPKERNWDDAVYRQWIEWNYARRLEIWDLFNRTTKKAGGPDCLWIGMNSGSISGQARSFRDIKRICERAEMMLMDHQSRSDASGFQQNTETGKLIHGLLGWDKVVPESMAMYQAGRNSFRVASKPAAEARMWMIAGFAGGIQPWWHHVGAYHEDRRMYRTAEPLTRWYKDNESYLVNRQPVAAVGLVWSQRNTDYYGRDSADELVEAPYRGFMQALVRTRVPWIPLHADHIERDGGMLGALILPNLGVMSDAQCSAVRRFVQKGGGLIASGAASLYDESGGSRGDFALADLFGVHAPARARDGASGRTSHTYLRLHPELRARVWGPKAGDEPPVAGERHAVLRGFDETDIIPFGGVLESLKSDPGVTVPLTFVPEFPIYPPETAWMRQPKTDIPGLVLKGRVAYLHADIDRRFGRDNLPDHGDLLANLVRWAAGDRIPLSVEGRGLIDCNLYAQPGRMILHIVNLTSAATWRAPIHELIPVGQFAVKVRLPAGARGARVRFLVAGGDGAPKLEDGWVSFEIKTVLDHEVAVIESAGAAGQDVNPGGEWQSLFDGKSMQGWRETPFTERGKLRVENGSIILEAGSPLTGITWTRPFPRSDYEVRLEGARLSGSDFFASMTFPVQDSFCTWVTGGWGGDIVGLSSLDGWDASDNETRSYFDFEPGRWYKLRLRVAGGRITAWIDDRTVVDVTITGRSIGLRHGEIKLSAPFGFASYATTGGLRKIEYRLLRP